MTLDQIEKKLKEFGLSDIQVDEITDMIDDFGCEKKSEGRNVQKRVTKEEQDKLNSAGAWSY